MSGNKNSPSNVQNEAKISVRHDGMESGIHESSTLGGMVKHGDGESLLDATPNPMSTFIPGSGLTKRLVDDTVDDNFPVKRLKLVNSDTSSLDNCYPKLQVSCNQGHDACQRADVSASRESNLSASALRLAPSDVPDSMISSSGDVESSSAAPSFEGKVTNSFTPSVVSPSKRQPADSSTSGASSSQSITPSVSLEAKVEQCTSITPAAAQDSLSSEGTIEAQSDRPPSPPLKSTKMTHLKRKYTGELEYMLREFRKLERQLLGAKGNVLEESAGSRERREKLHSFIIHLEGTIREIEVGCQLETEGKSTVSVGTERCDPEETEEQHKTRIADSAALAKVSREKEEEENVQKLEEHILANLLPVKVRLKKQLAAQQGATQNPAGMPARRGSLVATTSTTPGTTFAAAAEQRRKAEAARLAATASSAPVSTTAAAKPATSTAASKTEGQFSNPLSGGGSTLTQKLHGQSSGQDGRGGTTAAGESSESVAEKPTTSVPINGQKPASAAEPSGGSRDVTVEQVSNVRKQPVVAATMQSTAAPSSSVTHNASKAVSSTVKTQVNTGSSSSNPPPPQPVCSQTQPTSSSATPPDFLDDDCDDLTFTEEERKRMRKRKRRKKQRREAQRTDLQDQRDLMLHQQAVQAAATAPKGAAKRNNKAQATIASNVISSKGPTGGKKKGPRTVEYICALCSESYNSTCDYNPWWALVQHECPKCRKTQIPRVDISAPANAIEYHPALLASADDTGGGGGGGGTVASAPVIANNTSHIKPIQVSSNVGAPVEKAVSASPQPFNSGFYSDDSDSGSELSDELVLTDVSDDDSILDSDDSDLESFLQSFSPGEQAENESFGFEYTGPKMSERNAARLLILMDHASTCPGRHKSAQHREVCRSTKFLMLHVRDCPGTTSTFDVCPFPWCRKSKHLLYHLVSCTSPITCSICTPADLSKNLIGLRGLNEHRRRKQRERMLAASARNDSLSTAQQPRHSLGSSNTASTSRTPSGPQFVNTKPPQPQRQAPTNSAPKIISTSIKPISGQRIAAAHAAHATSSILQRPKASLTKVAAKPAASMIPPLPPVSKTSLASSISKTQGAAPMQSTLARVCAPPIELSTALNASPMGVNQAAVSSVPIKIEGQAEGTSGVVTSINDPGSAVSSQSCRSPSPSCPRNKTESLLVTVVPGGTDDLHAEPNVAAILTHGSTDFPLVPALTDARSDAEARLSCSMGLSTPSQNGQPIIKAEDEALDDQVKLAIPGQGAVLTAKVDANDAPPQQTGETVKVGC